MDIFGTSTMNSLWHYGLWGTVDSRVFLI